MALAPAVTLQHSNLRKTWNNFDVNNAINLGTAAANSKQAMFEIKEWLKTVTGMTVRNSCLDAAVSSSDLITAASDIVMAATGTWIVLGHSSGYQVLLQATSASAVNIVIALLGDFTTGTSSVNPTSTTQLAITLSVNGTSQVLWNGAASSDGKCFYVMTVGTSTLRMFAGVFECDLIEERANTAQFVIASCNTVVTTPTWTMVVNGAAINPQFFACTGFNTLYSGGVSTSYDSKHPAAKLGMGASPIVYAKEVYDVYGNGNSTTAFADRALSDAAAAEMISVGTNWMVPWNNTVLQVV